MRVMVNNDYITQAVEKYADLVLRIAYQSLKNRADAEDITQEAFLRLLKVAPITDEAHLKAWLIRVCINLCKDTWKSAWRQKTLPLDDDYDRFFPVSDESQKILEELWSLPQKQRNVLYLHYYEGYTVPEIAQILKQKPNTIYSQINRARKNLRYIIFDEGGEGR